MHNPDLNSRDTHNSDSDKLSLVCDVNYSADCQGGVNCYVTMAQPHPLPPSILPPIQPSVQNNIKINTALSST
jgi:hypothetical protein